MFGQTVLVLQGGGALGAYQMGVYQAIHESGIEPDWVVGTSIGAINGAIIAGNRPSCRLERLQAFWDQVAIGQDDPLSGMADLFGRGLVNLATILRGIPGFFTPNPSAFLGLDAPLGIEQAAYYSTAPLRQTLNNLVDFDHLGTRATRLTVGAVNARSGQMRYFDSGRDDIGVDHVMASGALPPAFPAVRIDGQPYWDGGLYSNNPVEVVLDDNPRRDSTIFSVTLWNPSDAEPTTLAGVTARQKDIQYSTRDRSHIHHQQQIHRLRRVIREMTVRLPPAMREAPEMQELSAWGCGTTMHLVRLQAPRLPGEDATKDIDFTAHGIRSRRQAGYDDAMRTLKRAPWLAPTHFTDGIVIHHMA
jgi:NTE family protein